MRKQVLRLVAAGERDVGIALILGIGVRTVRGYLDRIRDETEERRRQISTGRPSARHFEPAGARSGNWAE